MRRLQPSTGAGAAGTSIREGASGPMLITGEPGAGKTWLAERLVDELPTGWRALSVELTSGLDALEFLRLVADALGPADVRAARRGPIEDPGRP